MSRGRVLGTTDLEYARWRKGFRGGSFLPADDAADLMDIAVGVSPASIALGKKVRDMDRGPEQSSPTVAARRTKATTEHADLASALDREAALELELRGPDGSVIETEFIDLQDTEFLLSLSGDDFGEPDWCDELLDFDSEISAGDISDLDDDDLFDDDSWSEEFDSDWTDEPETPFPRYQIFVTLVDDADVP